MLLSIYKGHGHEGHLLLTLKYFGAFFLGFASNDFPRMILYCPVAKNSNAMVGCDDEEVK